MTTTSIIPEAWSQDAFLTEMVSHPLAAMTTDGAIVVEHRSRRGRAFVGVGEPAGVATLLERLDLSEPFAHGAMPRGAWDLVDPTTQAQFGLTGSEDWDWMDIEAVPQVPGMEQVRELDRVRERDVIERVRQLAIPDSYLSVDTGGSRWFGWADAAGQIRAIGGATGWNGTAWERSAHLGSIGTEPQWQGQGVGSALTAGITAIAVAEGATRVSLGVWADNARAIALYRRLGFTTSYTIHSRRRV